jgi:hypothetical protein
MYVYSFSDVFQTFNPQSDPYKTSMRLGKAIPVTGREGS